MIVSDSESEAHYDDGSIINNHSIHVYNTSYGILEDDPTGGNIWIHQGYYLDEDSFASDVRAAFKLKREAAISVSTLVEHFGDYQKVWISGAMYLSFSTTTCRISTNPFVYITNAGEVDYPDCPSRFAELKERCAERLTVTPIVGFEPE